MPVVPCTSKPGSVLNARFLPFDIPSRDHPPQQQDALPSGWIREKLSRGAVGGIPCRNGEPAGLNAMEEFAMEL
jgi:hypothetical protein